MLHFNYGSGLNISMNIIPLCPYDFNTDKITQQNGLHVSWLDRKFRKISLRFYIFSTQSTPALNEDQQFSFRNVTIETPTVLYNRETND